MAPRAPLLLAALAGAVSAAPTVPITGSLSYLDFKAGSNYAPEVSLLDLVTNTSSSVVSFADMSYESLFWANAAYDWRGGVLLVSMQRDSNISLGVILEVNLTSKAVVRVVNTTYCWFLELDEADPNTLHCLTEEPFYYPPGSPRRAVDRAEVVAAHLAAAATAAMPAVGGSRYAGRRARGRRVGDAQEGFYVRLDRTTGAASYVSTWIAGSVPDNEAVTYDRSKGVIYAQMSNDDSGASSLVGLDVATGAVVTNVSLPTSIIFYAFEYDRLANATYGLLSVYSGMWRTFFAKLDLATTGYTQVGGDATFDDYFQLNSITAPAPELRTLFTTAYANQSDPTLFLLGVDYATGAVTYTLPVNDPFVDIHYHAVPAAAAA